MTKAFVHRCRENVRPRRDEPESPHDGPCPPLTQEEYLVVRFAIDLVDRLGAEHGFDPAELVNPRTEQPFGPFIERLRRAMRSVEAAARAERYHDEQSAYDVPDDEMPRPVTGRGSLR